MQFAVVVIALSLASGDADRRRVAREELLDQLGAGVHVRTDDQHDTVRFLRIPLAARSGARSAPPAEVAGEFLVRHGVAFGIDAPARQLRLDRERPDGFGGHRVTFAQQVGGVDVFGAFLHVHLDEIGQVRAANGDLMVDFAMDPVPRLLPQDAVARALRAARDRPGVEAGLPRLVGLRAGAAAGHWRGDFLTYQVEVSDRAGYGERIFVDAHHGKVVERHSTVQPITRMVYVGDRSNLVWSEGDPRGGLDAEIERALDSTAAVYEFFANLSGGNYLSFDGADATMHIVYDIPDCDAFANAFWSGYDINHCAGAVEDDTVAHEWTHGYSDYTHNLIYAWQSGALNEAYSDIFGESIDLVNGLELDDPGGPRTDGSCSSLAGIPGLVVWAPADLAGDYAVATAEFGPNPADSPVTGELVVSQPAEGCEPFSNAALVDGNIALIARGTCNFTDKVANAAAAGATGAVIYNNEGDDLLIMAGDLNVDIPALFVEQTAGTAFAGEPNNTVLVTMGPLMGDDSYRWLIAEGSVGFGGAIRDLWAPSCFGYPEQVMDTSYWCDAEDDGGVHINSLVPSHAYVLLVDGGTFNGETITGIGMPKAAQIYWVAMTEYQTPYTQFSDHADALEAACADLVGIDVPSLTSLAASGEVVATGDCNQVAAAMRAVDMRTDPGTVCEITPMLEQSPPATCAGYAATTVYLDDFESDTGWVTSRSDTSATFTDRDWERVSDLPGGRDGTALHAPDPHVVPCEDDTGVLLVASPPITLPAGANVPVLVFDHYVATEAEYDGGDLRIRVDGGAWQRIEAGDFLFNPYNGVLIPDNPLAGATAFTGTDQGTNLGSWGESRVDLFGYASPGQTVEIQLRMAVDQCVGNDGWYVDNVRIVACECPVIDTDADGTIDCRDLCPNDRNKTEPGECGCGKSEAFCRDDNGDCGGCGAAGVTPFAAMLVALVLRRRRHQR